MRALRRLRESLRCDRTVSYRDTNRHSLCQGGHLVLADDCNWISQQVDQPFVCVDHRGEYSEYKMAILDRPDRHFWAAVYLTNRRLYLAVQCWWLDTDQSGRQPCPLSIRKCPGWWHDFLRLYRP